MRLLKQSTATTIMVGPVIDGAGAAVTTAVLADFNITKNGTTATLTGATVTHSHNGHYTIALTTDNTDTLNRLTITVNNAAMAMAKENFTVLNAATFDTLVTNGTLASTTSGRTLAVDASGIVTDTAGTTTLLSRLTSTRAGLLDNLDVAISVIQSQITALNNLSAKANWFGSALLEIPDSGTRAYVYELVIKDDEDKLVNLDALPTITLTNAAGTDRSALITTGIALTAAGRYTLTITVGTSTNNEALLLKATGTVSGETRYAVLATQVVDYDSGALINSIYTRLGVPATSSIAGDIAASKTVIDSIKTDTGTTIPGLFTTLTTKVRKFFQLIARKDTAIATDNATELSELNANGGSGAGAYSQATDSLEAIRDRGDAAWTTGSGGGGSGTGARTVTITVNDGTTALQNATVRLTEGANTFTASTNASGVATFNVDDATYTVAITKAGYSYSGTTLVVNGTEAETYSMTAITITPSTGDQTTGYLTTLDETGQAEAGVSIYVSVADVPNDYGLALDEATRTVVSNNAGLVEITGMVKGATYNLRRGLKGRLYAVTIPTSAGSTYELPNMAGV